MKATPGGGRGRGMTRDGDGGFVLVKKESCLDGRCIN